MERQDANAEQSMKEPNTAGQGGNFGEERVKSLEEAQPESDE